MKRELKKVLEYIRKYQAMILKQYEEKTIEKSIPIPVYRSSVIEFNKKISNIYEGLYYLDLVDKAIYYKVGKFKIEVADDQ